ncbi:hypothetical protein SprV_0200957000 [Sparganum proliferum]
MLRKKFRRLQDDVYLLKRTRQHLISCQATFKSKRQQLVNGLVGASNDLLSACQTALSRSEKRLEKIRKKSEKKVDEVLDIQKLTKQAIKLFRSVNSAARQRDTQNTCEVNEVALDAVEKLATAEMLDLESHCSEFQNYWLAPGLKNICAMLAELSLLVVDEQLIAANWAQTNLQDNSGHQTSSAPQTTAKIKSFDRPRLNLAPERPFNTMKQMPSVTTISIQQQQQLEGEDTIAETKKQQKKQRRLERRQRQKQDLQRHLDIGGSQNALEVSKRNKVVSWALAMRRSTSDIAPEFSNANRVSKANGHPRNLVNPCIRKSDDRPNRTDTKSWRALPYVKNVSEAVGGLLSPLGVGVAHRLEATIRRLVMKPKDPLQRLETSGVVYLIWCSCGQSNYVGEIGRLLRTRMDEHAAAVRRNDASSQGAAHPTRFGHTFKFDEAEILARGDNRVSRELLKSWFTGPQSTNKYNDFPIPYSVLRLRLGGVISLAWSSQVNSVPNARVGGSDGRAIITPTSNARDEIAAINDANDGYQTLNPPSATIPDEGGSRECS